MTVSTLGFTHSYYPGAAQAPERIPFQFLDIADLHVTADPTDLLLVAGTDYVISGSGEAATATITTLRTFASDNMVTIRRVSARVQQAVTEPFKPLPAVDIGCELDRRAMVEQELDGEISRALKVPRGQVGPLVDLRGAEGKILQLFGGKIRGVPYYVPPGGSGTGAEYNVLDYGAKGHGTDHDDTPGIQAAMDAAWYAGGGTVVIPATPAGYNLAGPNIPGPTDGGIVQRAVLKLRPRVSLRGVGMPRIKISGGRHNPPGMFFQAWWENDRIDDIDISGLWLDADCYRYAGPTNGNSYGGGLGAPENTIYQFQHAIAIWAGSNIRVHGNKFSGFRGSGVFPGNVGNASLNEYLCDNVHIHNNEFVHMFRDAVLVGAVGSGSIYHNWIHGDGYWVAAIDIERHSANETVTGIKAYQNFLDFSDGYAPVELNRLGTRLRRAGSIGFFYDGYPDDVVDGKFRGHSFTDNLIYSGVVDLWNATDCKINDNVIINDTAEAISNNTLITSAAISVRQGSGNPVDIRKVQVNGNMILHRIRCTAGFQTSHGIWIASYRDMQVNGNYVEGAELDGVRLDFCSGEAIGNRVRDIGTVADRRSAVVASAAQGQLRIDGNIADETRFGEFRTIAHCVALDGYFPWMPVVSNNVAPNVYGALIDGEELGLCHGNVDYTGAWQTNMTAAIGGNLRVAGEGTVGNSASDAALVISAGGGDRAQLILSQSGAIEWILGQLGDGTLIEQNFSMGMFERNVRIVYPDGTYQLALSWDQPLKANSNDYLWFEDGQLVVKSGSKATGPGQGTPLIGTGGGTSLDSVLASRALSSGDFPDRNDTIALLPVGAYFTSDETGEPRTYRAIATSPYYEDLGDEKALINKSFYISRLPIIPIEELGGIGDYDPDTGLGTDNAPIFAAAKAQGVGLQLKPGRRYMVASDIRPWSGGSIVGDESYSSEIHGVFATSGKRVIATDPSDPEVIRNFSMWGFTVVRTGPHPEHGVLIDNLDGLNADINVLADDGPLGGSFGVSAFYPENRPSRNCHVRLNRVRNGGNFALQFGNVDGGSMEIGNAELCHREVIGLEPYALGKYRFQASAVAADILYWPDHGLADGYPLIYSREGATSFANLAGKANYYFVIVVDADHIRVASSKEEALAGVPLAFGAPGSSTDFHAFIVCGILRNITVKGSNVDTADVVAGGTGTGSLIITATSGGYMEGINILPMVLIERNPTSGTVGVGIYGATGWTIDGLTAIGHNTKVVRAGSGTVNSISNATGDIAPKLQNNVTDFGLQVFCEGVLKNIIGREFLGLGVEVNGAVHVENCDMRSAVATGPAYAVTDDAMINRKPMLKNCVAKVSHATPFASTDAVGVGTGIATRQSGCRNLNDESASFEWIAKRRVRQTLQKAISSIAVAGTADAAKTSAVALRCADPNRSVSSFSGKIQVTVRQLDSSSTNQASYELAIIKASSSVSTVVTLLNSRGLTAGSASSHPSFVFGINAGGDLAVAVVGSTDPAATWYFDFESSGDLVLT